MLPNTNPLPPDNQVQELIRVHQHGHPILSRILQLHQFLYSWYFTDRAALYYLFYDPSILLPGNFYCQLQNPVYLDQYSPELLQYAVKSDCDSVWQSIDDQTTYTIVKNYIEKKEGNDRLLLLFLFNFISYVEIDGYTYFRNENPHPVKPLRNACLALFPELSRYLYANDCILDMSEETLLRFLCCFTALKWN